MLKQIVTAVFEKALNEPSFSPTYAQFCVKMTDKLPSFEDPEQKGKMQSFKRLILNRCQTEFDGAQDGSARSAADKKRTLGTISFIGELFVRQMLSSSIMLSCIKILMGKSEVPEEKNIESLCKLLATVGKELDRSCRMKSNPGMDNCFKDLDKLCKDKDNLSSRIRFCIKDTIELRANRWVTRRKEEKQTKLSEVHKAAGSGRSEKAERSRQSYNDARDGGFKRPMAPPPRRDRDRYSVRGNTTPRAGGGKAAQAAPDADGWSQAGSSSKRGKFGRSQDVRGNTPTHGGSKPSTPSSRNGDNHNRFSRSTPISRGDRRRGGGGGGAKKDEKEKKDGKAVFKPTNAFGGLALDSDEEESGSDTQEEEKSDGDTGADGQATDDGDGSGSDEGDTKRKESDEEVAIKTTISNFIREYLTSEVIFFLLHFLQMLFSFFILFRHQQELEEVIQCVQELPTQKFNYRVSYEGVKLVIEAKERARELFAEFLVKAVKEGVITRQNVLEGFDRIMEKVDDLLLDIPLTLSKLLFYCERDTWL